MENQYKVIEESEVSQWHAIAQAKCPRCRKGKMFAPGVFRQKMHERCPYCDLYFERHPGYFYVSMFVSYALNVAEFIILGVATYVLSGGSENMWLYMAVMLIAALVLAGFNFRYSRVLHMHYLDPGLRYEPVIAEEAHQIMLERQQKYQREVVGS